MRRAAVQWHTSPLECETSIPENFHGRCADLSIYLTKFGNYEVAFGIAIDDQDNIYAAMRNKHTIRKFVITKQ
jgi:hypothetical protein